MRSLIGMTFLNSSVGQRRLRQNGIVLRLGPVVADRRRATLSHRQGHCLDRQDLETLLLWLQRHFLCVPLEHLLEGPAPACLRIALSVDGNPAELAEQVYPLLERYEMPASAFIGGDPRSWREAVAETLWQADATAAGPLLELLEGYSGAALMAVFERTGDDQRRSRNLDLLLRKLERLDPASQQALHAACPVPAPYSAGDWERVRRLENSGLLRFGLRGQEPHPSAGLCAEDCLGRAHRQLQQHCAAPLPVFCQARTTPAAQPGLRAALGRLGYRFAFGARNGLVDTRCDPLDLPRIEVDAAIAARPGRLAWHIYRGARP
ncbi:polysaccharide deacetylase family protein [Pseudomonas aeruginosa]|uniref:polysaccharide deacetylase family protein n=1 Tax=Pseudomonas aeruginosa TaxID=287 RepID=UPI0018C2326B|nr:polysaccharide deacetylase family protein [Pseudomonas aeruginosa]QPP30831.1 polysaccharide deacetylase family protein [Pseudomonas aeruginosa]